MHATTSPTVLGKPLPQTKQEYLNLIYEQLRKGKLPAEIMNFAENMIQCSYRTSDGKACLIGLLMDDDHPKLGSPFDIQHLHGMGGIDLPAWIPIQEAARLQNIHDETAYNHSRDFANVFDSRLRADPFFSGCVFPEFSPSTAS
jgi:hypothetical protein